MRKEELGTLKREGGTNSQCHSSLAKEEAVERPVHETLPLPTPIRWEQGSYQGLIRNVQHRLVCRRLDPRRVELLWKLLKTLGGGPQLKEVGHQAVLGVCCP